MNISFQVWEKKNMKQWFLFFYLNLIYLPQFSTKKDQTTHIAPFLTQPQILYTKKIMVFILAYPSARSKIVDAIIKLQKFMYYFTAWAYTWIELFSYTHIPTELFTIFNNIELIQPNKMLRVCMYILYMESLNVLCHPQHDAANRRCCVRFACFYTFKMYLIAIFSYIYIRYIE